MIFKYMKWKKYKYYSDSDCGYTICVGIVNADGDRVYTASNPKREILGSFMDGSNSENVHAAMTACERHLKESIVRVA